MEKFFLFILAYSILKGLQDYVMINHSNSWKDKYKQPLKPIPKGFYGLYHRINGLSYYERFPLSGTLLVSLTDWWHLLGFARFWLIYYVIYTEIGITWQPIVLYWAGFAITYKLLRLIKKKA